MFIHNLSLTFARDLASVKAEILAYPDDTTPWATPPGAPNSGGNLALHIAGNLRHFIGAGLGQTGYVRNREAEFATTSGTRADLAALIDATAAEVATGMKAATDEALAAPIIVATITLPVSRALLHLAIHLGYHLGQLDYHRRLVTDDKTSVGTMGLPPLAG